MADPERTMRLNLSGIVVVAVEQLEGPEDRFRVATGADTLLALRGKIWSRDNTEGVSKALLDHLLADLAVREPVGAFGANQHPSRHILPS
jgi:hypothetical protein